MTRINIVPVETLHYKHLVAEYREITRLPKNLSTSLNRKSKPFDLKEIPPEYTLGKGHVKFFYDKMLFLKKRYEQLVSEMLKRGYNPTFTDSSIFDADETFNNDYTPTPEAIKLNEDRIKDRLNGL